MYDQIPNKFIASGKIETYLKENNIAVIHLVREAKVLNYASKQKKMEHTQDKDRAELLHHTPKHVWNDGTINWTLRLERNSQEWDDQLAAWSASSGIRSYYLRYEDLIVGEDRCADNLLQVMKFLQLSILEGGSEAMPPVNIHSNLLTLHSPTCDERIENYQEFAAHPRIVNSKTVLACDMINEYFASLSN